MESLLLLSSNYRRRYAEDILTALALPEGATIQFRYDADYVAPIVQRSVSNRERVAIPATIGFIAGVTTEHAFLLPIRCATVVSVEFLADVYLFKMSIGGYVNLDHYPMNSAGLEAMGKEYVEQIVNANGKYYPVVANPPDLHLGKVDDPSAQWRLAAQRLAVHPTFEKSCFLRVDPIRTHSGGLLRFDSDGRLEVVDGQSLKILISFFTEKYDPAAKQVLECITDGTFLRIASETTYDVALRYDSVEFWLHPNALNYDTLSRVRMRLTTSESDAATLSADVRVPVVVRRSRSRLTKRASATAAGALLVALPTILGSTVPVLVRISVAVLGAMLLAIAGTFLAANK